MPGESHSMGGKLVDPGRCQGLLPVTAKIAIPHIIGENKDNVWMVLLWGLKVPLAGKKQRQGKKKE